MSGAGGRVERRADTLPERVRRRLLVGLAASIRERGLAQTRVEDVVRHARTSRRTFYEHFADLSECFLELYRMSTDGLIAAIIEATRRPGARGESASGVIRAAVVTFFEAVVAEPALSRAHFREIFTLGPRGLEARRLVVDRHADALRRGLRRAEDPKSLTPTQATLIVGAVNELVLQAFEQDRLEELPRLVDDIVTFIDAVISSTR